MLVLVLLAVVSMAAAQCGNRCSCGNAVCCRDLYSASSPYSIFNVGYGQQYSYRQSYGGYGQGYGYGGGQQGGFNGARRNRVRTPCLKVTPIQVTLEQFTRNQPLYTRVMDDSEDNRQIDNICTTFFPLPDDSTTFINYDSYTYADGSNDVVTTIITEVGTGTALRGNGYFSINQRVFASLGNNMFIACNSDIYGDNDEALLLVLSAGRIGAPLGASCVQQIRDIVHCVGQDEGGLFVLPYRYPTRCVTQQACALVNPLLNPYRVGRY